MNLKENYALIELNTFHLDVTAKYFTEISSLSELKDLIQNKRFSEVPKLILGGGSNILFTKDFTGIVIKNKLKGIEIIREDNDFVWIRSGSGETWNDLVMFCVSKNYGGIENLSLIPGTVGAAPMQNIGAYGVELKETFEELEAIHMESGELRKFNLPDCKFGYRESIFKHELKNQFMILNVTLRLRKNPVFNTSYGAIETELKSMGITKPGVKEISLAVCNIRQSKLPNPDLIGNAGSFFKNPEVSMEKYESLKRNYSDLVAYPASSGKMKLAAGWMIEQCGWKGKVSGNVGMHRQQALVLVNYGNATGEEVFAYAKKVRESILEKFGVTLEMEVNII
jgi:UDP-N-acetylmuramate dehydrogenase